MRDMTAERLFSQVVTGGLEGPCTATAADPFELALAAFALQAVIIPQGLENLRMLPDVAEGGLPNVSAEGGEETAGLDVADMGDEAEADTAEASAGDGIEAVSLE